ncbi:unnamed protein product [Parnassius mnemosyne]|uniref:Reverse transcriptase domain-containing protein n=1 Tax=Parnassius mnemosyne TaxID=213953 RepID=A0AAV1MA99_9NEOP
MGENLKVVVEGQKVVILLPIDAHEELLCPLCTRRGRYVGVRKIENLYRHCKEHHAEKEIHYRCWRCGYMAPEGKRYPRKIVSQHCSECVTDHGVNPRTTERERRNGIRRDLGVTNNSPRQSLSPSQPLSHPQVGSVDLGITNQRITGTPVQIVMQTETTTAPRLTDIDYAISGGPNQNTSSHRHAVSRSDVTPERIPRVSEQPLASEEPVADGVNRESFGNSRVQRNIEPLNDSLVNMDSSRRPQNRRYPTAEQRRYMEEIDSVSNSEEFEEVARRAMSFLCRFTHTGHDNERRLQRHRSDSRRPVRVVDRMSEAALIQGKYRKNRKKTVQQVLNGPARYCKISKSAIEQYFTEMAAPRNGDQLWPDVFNHDDPTSLSELQLLKVFERKEVMRKLKSKSNTSPGPDGLTYGDLRKADPGAFVLTALFNAVWRLEVVPGCWKDSNTILLHKKGPENDISNWRPISMGDTCPKLFAAIVADRVKTWAVANRRYSTSQKGFLPYEGCYEHNFVLQETIQQARRDKGEVVVAWLDLASAFNSVPHSSIHRALEQHGMPAKVRNVIDSLYKDTRTKVRTSEGFTDPIRLQSGVKQGCPLSPHIFNLTLEVVIRAMELTGEGFKIRNRRITTLAYADDIVVLADTPEGMRRLLNAAEEGARSVGLVFNPAKCATLHIKSDCESAVQDTILNIQGEPMKSLGPNDYYEHLGIPTGYDVGQTPRSALKKLLADVKKIDESLLAPWQKLDAVGTFVLPRLYFIMQGADVEKEYLREVDRIVKNFAKRWLNLPHRASSELVFLPPSMGGGGLMPLSDLLDLYTVTHAFKMLCATDDLVCELAREGLKETVSERLRKVPSNIDMARYLSGDLDLPRSTSRSSFWTKARSAARRMQSKITIRWIWHRGEEEFHIQCGNGAAGLITPSSRQSLFKKMRLQLVQYYARGLQAKKDQGKVFEVTCRTGFSNHFLRSGRNTRFCDWRFVHRARLGVLPLNAIKRWQTDIDKRCRRCGREQETIPHVLNHCGLHSAARQLRHNNIQSRLVKALRYPGLVTTNQTVEGTHGAAALLRPDIVVRDEVSKEIKIVDVTVPFENRLSAFRAARMEKITKYGCLAEQLRARGYRVSVNAFIVGSLGGWDDNNQRVLDFLKVGRFYARMMRRFMISDTIRWSRDIYVEHVSGIRQYTVEHDLDRSVNVVT